jgi:hypothetical protein
MTVGLGLASPSDDEGVRRLVRTQAMPGRVRVSFCREPDFAIGCAVTGDDHRILVARAAGTNDVVGVACRSIRRVFLNGREQRIGYLGQLRIDPQHRGRWLVSRGLAMLAQMHRQDPLPAYLASIVDGNDEATGVLVHKPRRSFPEFREVARYVTLALRVRGSSRWSRSSRECPPSHPPSAPLDEIAEFLRREGARRQLHAVWTADALRGLQAYGLHPDDFHVARLNGAIAGVVGLWDQSAYKQSVIRGYSGWLRAAAPLLPPPGTRLHSAYASLICIRDDDPGMFRSLLKQTYTRAAARGFQYLLIGLDTRDPLLHVARAYSHVAYPSRLYLVSWPDGGPSYEPPDARPVYVDIATL